MCLSIRLYVTHTEILLVVHVSVKVYDTTYIFSLILSHAKATKDRLTRLKYFSLNVDMKLHDTFLHLYIKSWFFLKTIEKRSCQMKQQEPVDAVK